VGRVTAALYLRWAAAPRPFICGDPSLASEPYIFFDVDDTLVEWTVSWTAAFAQVAGEAGVVVSREQVEAGLAHAFGTAYDGLVRKHAATGDESAFWLDYDGHVLGLLGVEGDTHGHAQKVVQLLARPRSLRLFPEVEESLASLRAAGARLGIVTARPLAGPDLEALGIGHYFDPVIDAFHAGGAKRGGRVFQLAAERAAEAGCPAWHVGDSYEDDVGGARAAGLLPILVDRKELHQAADCHRVSDLREVARIALENRTGAER